MKGDFIKKIMELFAIKDPIIYANPVEPSIEDYIKNRYKEQIRWYDEHSRNSRIMYYILQSIIIMAGASIPIINVFPSEGNNIVNIKIASATLGSLIVIMAGILQTTKCQENWVSYRSTAELLKSEYQKFKLGAGDYAEEKDAGKVKRNQIFVDRVETIISGEGKKFLSTHDSLESIGSSESTKSHEHSN